MTAPTNEEIREALASLWTREYGELELQIRQCLTEPTLPWATITTESGDGPRFMAYGDTIEDAVRRSLLITYTCLILREAIPVQLPFVTDLQQQEEEAKIKLFLSAVDSAKKDHH